MFKIGDEVDVWWRSRWWKGGLIAAVHEKSASVRFEKSMYGTRWAHPQRYRTDYLRLSESNDAENDDEVSVGALHDRHTNCRPEDPSTSTINDDSKAQCSQMKRKTPDTEDVDEDYRSATFRLVPYTDSDSSSTGSDSHSDVQRDEAVELTDAEDDDREARKFANAFIDDLDKEGFLKKGKLWQKNPRLNKRERVERDLRNHPILPSCTCRMKCAEKISDEERRNFHEIYWKEPYETKKAFLRGLVHRSQPSRRKTEPSRPSTRNRTIAMKFFIPTKPTDNNDEDRTQVCQKMFLSTLGFGNGSNRVIKSLYHEEDIGQIRCVKIDQRGRHKPKHAFSEEQKEKIFVHVESFHPQISHYRREHAPNRRYLPSEITISMMHEDFTETFESISYESYRQAVSEAGITFSNLGNEECEECNSYKHHIHKTAVPDCQQCTSFQAHCAAYREARTAYQNDGKRSRDSSTVIVSADLMKVFLLPKLPLKVSLFTSRVVTFNETFSPLASSCASTGIAYCWDESVAGRSAADIASTFCNFVLQHRDAKHFIIWVDNCAAQNKNWLLFSSLVRLVNRDDIAAEKLEIKYLESGHTFMSADADHGTAGKQLKQHQFVYDIEDFRKSISSDRVEGKCMKFSDFFELEDLVSQHQLRKLGDNRPFLSDIVCAMFRKGSCAMFFKFSHQKDYECFDGLLKNYIDIRDELKRKRVPRGISTEKKNAIKQKLLQHMPPHRRCTWENMPESKASADLLTRMQ